MSFITVAHKSTLIVIITLILLESSKQAVGDGNISNNSQNHRSKSKFILYDVNTGEGFNLKRDVYMRMAMFVTSLSNNVKESFYLVLPPWNKQWHWTNEGRNISHLWSQFFDVKSLQLYAPVIEIDEFYIQHGDRVDEVYVLQHFPEFYEWVDGNNKVMDWSDRWSFADCRDHLYWGREDATYKFFYGGKQLKASVVKCISFQGSSEYLQSVVLSSNASAILFDHAEIVTHGGYGDENYWMCRRSMRFSKNLIKAAHDFRSLYLNSSDKEDRTIRPSDWRDEVPHRSANGGPYLSVHLRRRDFLKARANEVPSLTETVVQIQKYLTKLKLSTVFVATDMLDEEYEELSESLKSYQIKFYRYTSPSHHVKHSDGELAIIDQIISSHARFFIGTHESTFSFRVQEEREIMGFPYETTFNRFCKDSAKECTQPTKWLIKFPSKNEHSDMRKRMISFKHLNSDEL